MKLPIYTSTPGLDRYPERERFAVYRATHKRLISEDAAYRRKWSSHVAGIVCVAIVPAGGFVGGGALDTLLSIVLMAAVLAGVMFLAFRQQKFMNRRIGDALQRQATS
jgi:hypothetical protein